MSQCEFERALRTVLPEFFGRPGDGRADLMRQSSRVTGTVALHEFPTSGALNQAFAGLGSLVHVVANGDRLITLRFYFASGETADFPAHTGARYTFPYMRCEVRIPAGLPASSTTTERLQVMVASSPELFSLPASSPVWVPSSSDQDSIPGNVPGIIPGILDHDARVLSVSIQMTCDATVTSRIPRLDLFDFETGATVEYSFDTDGFALAASQRGSWILSRGGAHSEYAGAAVFNRVAFDCLPDVDYRLVAGNFGQLVWSNGQPGDIYDLFTAFVSRSR